MGQQGAQPQKMEGKWVGAALYQGLSLFIKGTWFPSGVFSQWTEEHKKASDCDRLCHVVSGHICSHILDGKTLNCLLWTIFNGGEVWSHGWFSELIKYGTRIPAEGRAEMTLQELWYFPYIQLACMEVGAGNSLLMRGSDAEAIPSMAPFNRPFKEIFSSWRYSW